VLGWDLDRDAPRTFRLSRVRGAVKDVGRAETDSLYTAEELRAKVAELVDPPEPAGEALVWVERGAAEGLRRLGSVVGERELDGTQGDLVSVPLRSVQTLARVVAGYGASAVAIEPAQLRDEVIARLQRAAG
jgi:proteasome accessory factor B